MVPTPGPGVFKSGGGGGGSPTFIIAGAATPTCVANVCTLTLDATGVTTFYVGITYETGSSCSATITSVVGGSGGVDVFTQVGSASSNAFQCVTGYLATSIHTSSTYNIVLTGLAGVPGLIGMGALGFTGVTVLDGSETCTGFSSGSSPASCSGALTPSVSIGACVAVAGDYYTADTITAGTGYTIPANGSANQGTNGNPAQISMLYQLCTSASTPSVASTGTIYIGLAGAALK